MRFECFYSFRGSGIYFVPWTQLIGTGQVYNTVQRCEVQVHRWHLSIQSSALIETIPVRQCQLERLEVSWLQVSASNMDSSNCMRPTGDTNELFPVHYDPTLSYWMDDMRQRSIASKTHFLRLPHTPTKWNQVSVSVLESDNAHVRPLHRIFEFYAEALTRTVNPGFFFIYAKGISNDDNNNSLITHLNQCRGIGIRMQWRLRNDNMKFDTVSVDIVSLAEVIKLFIYSLTERILQCVLILRIESRQNFESIHFLLHN